MIACVYDDAGEVNASFASLLARCQLQGTEGRKTRTIFQDTLSAKPHIARMMRRRSAMRISVIGKGHVGGGLAKRWTAVGHEVTSFGREGGDASGAEVVLVAVPSSAIADGFARVTGLRGQITIDATNTFAPYPAGVSSLAQQVKSIIGGPTAKAFNTNFAALYDRVEAETVRPGTLFAADAEARSITEQLIRDAGFDPIYLGDLGQARLLESLIALTQGIAKGGMGPFFYRFNGPGAIATR